MPSLSGFSDNPFQSRDDILQATTSLLRALKPYKSPCGARIKLATATGAGFDDVAAQLEGFARPLWIVSDLLATHSTPPATASSTDDLDLESWVRGLEAGVDIHSKSFWGHLGDHDQRMVEMEPIAYALLSAPSAFFPALPKPPGLDSQSNRQNRERIVTWLRSINDKTVPPSNWRWFRVLVNLALVKSCGIPYQEVKPFIDEDFKILDSFYLGDGWSSDGLWSDDKRQADYYAGSFAIQYSQLAYVRFAGDIDPERVERYRLEAGKFATTFWRYFDVDGAAIPFGRSLTYRFAFAAFWAAIAVTDIPLPPPLNNRGVVKGLLLRHLRWWARHGDIFNTDGTLSIGYTYPNMSLSEDYNSPQSVYWCLKSFAVLGLIEDHPFWKCEELPHPLSSSNRQITAKAGHQEDPQSTNLSPLGVIHPPVQITSSFPEHHFLISAGQSTKKPHRAREAKYCKFAYSSHFAFSVPAGPLLAQLAPDSTLCISDDDGDTWRVRWEPEAARIETLRFSVGDLEGNERNAITSPVLISSWKPWKSSSLQIATILIPTLEKSPGWHFRIHKLTWQPDDSVRSFQIVDAGFAISSKGAKGTNLPTLTPDLQMIDPVDGRGPNDVANEGIWEERSACLILSDAGASGVAELSVQSIQESNDHPRDYEHTYRGRLLKPDANTNLVAQRTLIPTLHNQFSLNGAGSGEAWFITGVFAVSGSAGLNSTTVREMWQNKPSLKLEEFMNML